MTAPNDRITVSMSEGVADVRMVRVDKMNALDAPMFNALVDTAERLRTEKACARWFCLVRAGRSALVSIWGVLPQ